MRTIEINVLKFDELSEKAKENAIEYFSNINVDHEWWDFVNDDAKSIGLDIVEFDLDNGHIEVKVLEPFSKIKKLVMKNHGKETQTYKIVDQCDLRNFKEKHSMLHQLKKQYLKMLCDNYEFLISENAIIESIKANDFEFYENGKFFF